MFFAGYIESTGFFTRKFGELQGGFENDEPGNYGVGFPNFFGKVTDPAARASKLNAELANGRLATLVYVYPCVG